MSLTIYEALRHHGGDESTSSDDSCSPLSVDLSDADHVSTSTTDSRPAESSSSSSTSSDSDYRPTCRRHAREDAIPQMRTMARRDGLSLGAKTLQWLRIQHQSRCSDTALLSLLPESDRPKPTRWAKMRSVGIAQPLQLMTLAPLAPETPAPSRGRAVNAPPPRRRVLALGAAVGSIQKAFDLLIPLLPTSSKGPVLLVCLGADAKGDSAPGMSHGGKVYSLFAKVVNITSSHQSPEFAIPIMLFCNNDSPKRILATFEAWGPKERLAAVQTVTDRDGRQRAVRFFWLGDYPAAYSVTELPRVARQLPRTKTTSETWVKPMCWLCGAGGHVVYRPFVRPTGPPMHYSALGLPLTRVFYGPVHAIAQLGLALLCDIGRAFWCLRPKDPHPFALFVRSRFPRACWDPFGELPKNPERHSNKPFMNVDPAVAFTFFYDAKQNLEGLRILAQKSARTLRCAPVPSTWPSPVPRTPLAIWFMFQLWLECISSNDPEGADAVGNSLLQGWLCMNAAVHPLQAADRPPHGFEHIAPAFDCRFTAYGPAAHAAVCSMPRLMRLVSGVDCGGPGISFLKKVSEIWLEHSQGETARTFGRFDISASPRCRIPQVLLQRLLEKTIIALSASDDKVAKRGRMEIKPAENRAYRDVPLSMRIDRCILTFPTDPSIDADAKEELLALQEALLGITVQHTDH